MTNLNVALEEVTRSVISLETRPDELRRYLDMLEESDLPHGDILHQHACELASSIMGGFHNA